MATHDKKASVEQIQQICAQMLQEGKQCIDALQNLQKNQKELLQECGVEIEEPLEQTKSNKE